MIGLDPTIRGEMLKSLAAVFIASVAYCIPALTAWYRSHHNTAAITAVNLLLGWTVIGWIWAFIWALTRPPAR